MEIRTKNLGCAQGGILLLSGIDFELSSGDCLILRGPNGIGKSTLLNVLAGLAEPADGSVEIDPELLVYSGHQDAIKLQLTARENLEFWDGVYHTSNTGKALDAYDLNDFSDRPVATLSAGQKRRVGLARLYLSDRKIWIMDEPTTSLDAENRSRITDRINAHIEQGGIAILSTHMDLDIPNAHIFDVEQYIAKKTDVNSPFLEGDF